MQIIYLIFNEGHAATRGPRLTRTDLADEAIRLARQLHGHLPQQPEAAGLLALLLLTAARRRARSAVGTPLVPLDEQDRSQWNQDMIVEGLTLLTGAISHHAMGDYQLQAAIAAVHDQAPSYDTTDWTVLRALYNLLVQGSDNPFARLNRAVVIAHTDGPDVALHDVQALHRRLADHHRFHATIGYIHHLAGRHDDARLAMRRRPAWPPTNSSAGTWLERRPSVRARRSRAMPPAVPRTDLRGGCTRRSKGRCVGFTEGSRTGR